MKKTIRKFAGLVMAGAMFVYMPAVAMAERYNIANVGNIRIDASVDGDGKTIYTVNGTPDDTQIILTGTTDSGVEANVVINSGAGAKAVVVFDGLNIDNSGHNNAAVVTTGSGDVTIELDGNSSVKSGYECAGIQKENTGLLTIRDSNGTAGSLEAQGGEWGAGIGGGRDKSANNIVIESGEVTATGGQSGAGIGGGSRGSGTITIKGGEVTATGGNYGAGIGGGADGSGTITIKGGEVTATGGNYGAGIGGGSGKSGTITIKGGEVTANGGNYGAGIGGGNNGSASNIVIESGEVAATGGKYGAGIGGGYNGSGTVTITGGEVTALGINGGAGIGGGPVGAGTVNISGGTVIATSDACGAGIGGGYTSRGSVISISGSANVYASGGKTVAYLSPGAGSAIGEGGNVDPYNQDPVEGVESYDATGFYDTGSINLFPAGTTVEQITKNQVQGTTIKGTVPDPNAPVDDTKEEKMTEAEPEVEEPPAYTERSCIADIDVAALIAELLKRNPNATVLDLEFEDNICLTPELMTALFADNRVSKNCYFWYKGKRYVLHIGPVNKQSPLYAEDFATLAAEPDGLAGFMRMAKIFGNLGVEMAEVK